MADDKEELQNLLPNCYIESRDTTPANECFGLSIIEGANEMPNDDFETIF